MRALVRAPRVAAAKRDVMKLVSASRRGVAGPPRAEVEAAIDALLEANAGAGPPSEAALTACWELAWTSEREVLWLIENAGLFGTETGPVYQSLDLSANTLSNVVTFPPTGAFVVQSSAAAEPGAAASQDALRVRFAFTAARLDAPFGRLPLPPYGKGWFDNVYVDDDIRIARDVRGDTLICERAGAPRAF